MEICENYCHEELIFKSNNSPTTYIKQYEFSQKNFNSQAWIIKRLSVIVIILSTCLLSLVSHIISFFY